MASEGTGMDHRTIDEQQIAERYVLGTLPPGEAVLFEEHSLACAECLDRIEAARGLAHGLREAAVLEAARRLTLRALLSRLARSPRAALALSAAVALVALLPSGVLWQRLARLRGDLAGARAELAARPPEARHAGDDGARRRLAAAEGELARERGLRAGLEAAAKAEAGRLAAAVETARRPAVNVPVVTLSPERSAAGEAAARLVRPDRPGWVVLKLELEPPIEPRYCVRFEAMGGRVLWQAGGLEADATDSLVLSLPAELLPSGTLALVVTAEAAGRSSVPVGRFRFTVTPPSR